ncbi:hypothetical protein DMUE_0565 [Dictyocoela muelleri]|nr:hypothetical protein DMUE_0565 [Dictyocoela muelleri]
MKVTNFFIFVNFILYIITVNKQQKEKYIFDMNNTEDPKNFEKLKLRIKNDKPIAIVSTNKKWKVTNFFLKKKQGEIAKDLTDRFNSEFLKNKGKTININYGKINNAKDGDIFYFILIDNQTTFLRSINYRYNGSKKQLNTNVNPSEDSNIWGWMLFIFILILIIVLFVLYYVLINNNG